MNTQTDSDFTVSIPSPCTGVCRLEVARRFCVGCGRTTQEIAAWPTASAQARLTILQAVRVRQKK